MMRQRFSTVLGCVGSQKKIVSPSTGAPASAPKESKLGFSTLFGKTPNTKKQGASSLKLKEGICFSCSSSLKASSQKHSSTRGYAKKESTLLGDYLFRQTTHPLDKIFKPNTVAVIGASEKPGSVGRTLLWNLLATPFGGTIYPVNPKRKNVMGILSYPDIKSIKEPVDLAVICIPAPQVPKAVQDCVDAGVKGAIVISAGFSEAGEQGKEWAKEMVEIARKGGMRIIGPNCLGVMNPQLGLNATFATTIAPPGKVALISQSGALATAILDFAIRENVGFSAFMSIGSMADVNWGDLIEFLGRDPQTEAIILYMESIGDARSFINAARDVALTKPIVVIKVGRTEQGGKAAASHTGTLTGSDNVLDAAFKRCGILRVETIEELFYMAQTLAKQPRPKGNRLSIITNAGGPGALSTDALYSGGGQLSELSEETMEALNKLLPEHWSKGNPIDVLGDAPPERYAKTFEIVSKDNKADGLLVILTPQAMSEPTQTAEALKQYAASEKKPILASWMGGSVVEAGKRILTNTGIPTFEFPDVAVKVFNYMWQYSKNLETLYEQPDLVGLLVDVSEANREAAKKLIETARKSGRTILTEAESKELMKLYGIPTTSMIIAENEDKAVAAAKEVGFPVVLKIHSETITHKADVGGVKLNLEDEAAVRHAFREIQGATSKSDFLGVSVQKMVKMKDAYEVIFGMNTDQQIGPTILFGTGGTYVEVYKDTVIGLPPLTKTLSKNMIRSTKIYKALSGYRGKPKVDLNLLENLLVRFSQLATDLNTLVQEIDINPLLISATGAMALDARVVVYPPTTDVQTIPKCAIRPYPVQYIHHTTTKAGEKAIIRPVRIEDHYSLLKFFERMTNFMLERGKEHGERYYQAFTKILQQQHMADLDGSKKYLMFKESKKMWDMTVRLCIGDYDSEVVMIIELPDKKEKGTGSHIVGIAMYTRRPYPENSGELSVVIDEEFHRVGLGQQSLEQLISVAKEEGLKELVADINSTNTSMVNLVEKLGFETKQVAVQYQDGERKEVIATLHL